MRDGEHRAQGGSDIVRTRTLRLGLGVGALLGATVLVLGLSAAALGTISDSGTYDLTVPDNTTSATKTTTGGAIVEYVGSSASDQSLGSSGTGVFEPFYQLQGSPSEAGYNTDGTVQFETKQGSWTHSILLSSIPVVSVGGHSYWEVWADINEANSTKLISLNKFEVYFASGTGAATLTGYPFTLNGTNPTVTEEYAFDGSFEINDVNQGSGRADLRYLIPVTSIPANCDYFNPACTTYFVLYTQWGSPTATTEYASDGGFEELDVKQYPTLQIVKNTVGGDGTFGFSVVGPTPLSPTITTSGGTGSTSTYAVIPGTFQITESSSPAGWALTGATCSFNGGTPSSYTPGSDLVLASTDHVVCTFTNGLRPTLELKKVWVGAGGQTTLQIGTAAGGSQVDSQLTGAAGAAPLTTGTNTVDPGTYYMSETGGLTGYASSFACTKNGNAYTPGASDSVTVAYGDVVICTYTNSQLPTLTIIKTVKGPSATFSYTVTGANTLSSPDTNLTPADNGSAQYGPEIIAIGSSTISEDAPPAGYTLTDVQCTGYTGGGTGAGTLDSNGIPTSWNFIAAYGDNVVCSYVNEAVLTTRTQGFWATHTALANNVWNGTSGLPGATPLGGDNVLCGVTITALDTTAENVLMGGFWANISKTSTGAKRSSIDQARMQMLQQYLAAVLNVHAFGGSEAMLSAARTAYCGSDISAIKAQIGILGTFNQSGDSGVFTPGASATAQLSKSQADIDAWDNPTVPQD